MNKSSSAVARQVDSPKTQGRHVRVEVVSVKGVGDTAGQRVAANVHIRVVADDDVALWRFFNGRKSAFENEIKSAIAERAGSDIALQRIEYRRGSIEIIMLLVAVAGNYANIKQNVPIALADLVQFAEWLERAVAPVIVRRIEQFFLDYVTGSVLSIAKSFFKSLFG